MPSFFDGWSAVDIVGSLNKREVRALLLDFGIEKSCFRSWDAIEEMILGASDEVKDVVYQSAKTKENIEERHRLEMRKRRLETQVMMRNIRRRIGFFFNLSWLKIKRAKKKFQKRNEIFRSSWYYRVRMKSVNVIRPSLMRHRMKRLLYEFVLFVLERGQSWTESKRWCCRIEV